MYDDDGVKSCELSTRDGAIEAAEEAVEETLVVD